MKKILRYVQDNQYIHYGSPRRRRKGKEQKAYLEKKWLKTCVKEKRHPHSGSLKDSKQDDSKEVYIEIHYRLKFKNQKQKCHNHLNK